MPASVCGQYVCVCVCLSVCLFVSFSVASSGSPNVNTIAYPREIDKRASQADPEIQLVRAARAHCAICGIKRPAMPSVINKHHWTALPWCGLGAWSVNSTLYGRGQRASTAHRPPVSALAYKHFRLYCFHHDSMPPGAFPSRDRPIV